MDGLTPPYLIEDLNSCQACRTGFCQILGVKRKLSTAYHPEIDGQSENTNQ